jgi:hypothetical protein
LKVAGVVALRPQRVAMILQHLVADDTNFGSSRRKQRPATRGGSRPDAPTRERAGRAGEWPYVSGDWDGGGGGANFWGRVGKREGA